MGNLKHFDIELDDNPSGVYFGGDVVKGKLSLGLEGEGKTARGVHVELKGECKVAFSKRKGTGKSRRTRYYTDSETYVKERKYVVGDGSNKMEIEAGEYQYDFEFRLPEKIASSFVGKYGRVAYSVTGVIDRPWKFDHETVVFFTVICHYDLNREDIKEWTEKPVSMDDHKNLCCWCCKSGPLSGSLKSDHAGYVPGEILVVQAMADNKTNVLMEAARLTLQQTVTFKVDKFLSIEEKEEENLISVHDLGKIDPGESETWPEVGFKIPVLPPSKLENCTKIDIKYRLLLTIDPVGCHMSLSVPIDIAIGTIPLQSMFNKYTPNSSIKIVEKISMINKEEGAYKLKNMLGPNKKTEPKALEAEGNDLPPTSSPPSGGLAVQSNIYPDLPLPTYAEATAEDQPSMRMEDDNEHSTGNWDFQPIYPYYQISEK